MTKYYIIPMIGSGTSQDPKRPKYLDELGIHWAGIDFPNRSIFLLKINTQDAQKITSLEVNADVIDITANTTAIRTRLKLLNNIDSKTGDDLVEKVGRLKFANFLRGHININPLT